jgi:hypothetical protein
MKFNEEEIEMANHHNVYVIQLGHDVLGNKKFRKANPFYRHDTDLPPVYVGMTGRKPEERFEQHRRGYKACKFVRNHGIRLLPNLYEHLNPMTFNEARDKEMLLASELRRRGYPVWQN